MCSRIVQSNAARWNVWNAAPFPGEEGRHTLCAVERRAVEHVERCAIPRVWLTNASRWGQWVKVLVVEATLLLALGSVVER